LYIYELISAKHIGEKKKGYISFDFMQPLTNYYSNLLSQWKTPPESDAFQCTPMANLRKEKLGRTNEEYIDIDINVKPFLIKKI